MPLAPLSPEALRTAGLPAELEFHTSQDLEDLDGSVGQDRAVEALRFALAVEREGYGAYVMGPPGSGKHALVLQLLGRAAAERETPSDWCYLHDFAEPRRPRAVELPPGQAQPLRRDLDRLAVELRGAVQAALASAEHRARIQALEKELEEARDHALEEVRQQAMARSVALLRTPVGYGFAPVRDGAVVEPDAFASLPEEDQERFKRDIGELQGKLQLTLRAMPDLERRHRERVRDASRDAAFQAAGHVLAELRRRYADLPAVLQHLDAIQADVAENVHELSGGADGGEDGPIELRRLLAEPPALHRYGANVLVDHSGRTGAPVVFEDLPTLANLCGRIEHHAHLGTLLTDFTLIRPGALHRANGGYLVLDTRRLLAQPFAWDELKRALRAGEIRIEPPERLLGIGGATSLEPRPIPLSVKVVLVGERIIHRLLNAYDPDFSRLFKVEADLEDDIPRSAQADLGFARLVATLARRERLRALDRGAVERVLREASRLAGDSLRLTADLEAIRELLVEADHEAEGAGRGVVTGRDVAAAIAAAERRAGRAHDALQAEIARGTLVVETSGAREGQVNGLSVVAAGRRLVGRPNRITARVRLGRGEVVDIEREVELGGPIHSKGVLILAGYLGARYASERPLTLAATIVFEQSYGGVEGDSASCAELCALLSAVARVPVRQALAVTGSVDQLGRVQAVGGVTEKVEGFFDVCRARGLTGEHGVLVPRSNVPHLVLRDEVIGAVKEGLFRIWPVETVDEALELLTGLPAGAPDSAGDFPPGTFNARVAARLEALAEAARAFARETEPPRSR